MNLKIKSSLIIIATLLIGITIGVLGVRLIARPPLPKMIHQEMTHKVLKMRIKRMIGPTAEQWEKIEPVLKKYARRMHEKMEKDHHFIRLQKDSLISEIKPFLTREQLAKLVKFEKHEKKRFGGGPGMCIRPGFKGANKPGKGGFACREKLDSLRQVIKEEIKLEMEREPEQGKD
ncbi:MAG: hypothetical protein ABIA63_14360 [bacterium]